MSASPSTRPAVKARLKDLFTAATEDTTEVWRPRPNEEHQVAENVYICGVKGDSEWRNVGGPSPTQREENYAVSVEVEVYREGTDAEGAEIRLEEIVAQLEAAIATDPKLGIATNVQWALVEHFEQETEPFTDGVLAKHTFEVAVKARI